MDRILFTSSAQAAQYGAAMPDHDFDRLTKQYDEFARLRLESATLPAADLFFIQSQLEFIDIARRAYLDRRNVREVRSEARLELVTEEARR